MVLLSAASCWNIGGDGKQRRCSVTPMEKKKKKAPKRRGETIEQDGGSDTSSEDEVEAEMKGMWTKMNGQRKCLVRERLPPRQPSPEA